jgi:hypothetical protein
MNEDLDAVDYDLEKLSEIKHIRKKEIYAKKVYVFLPFACQ